jgi:hypothetical protein
MSSRKPAKKAAAALSPKQARFVAEYLKDQNATQGSRLLMNVEVAAAVGKSQTKVAARAEVTLQGHLTDLKKLRDAASRKGQFSAAITAEVARGKVSGFHVEHHKHSGAIGTYDLTKLSDDQLDHLESILGPLAHAGGDPGGEGEAAG